MRKMSTWFFISFVWITSIIAVAKPAETDKWSSQLSELKVLMTNMNTKLSLVEAKVSGLQVLEYAFKVNSLDSSLRNLDLKVNQMATQIDTITESVKANCEGAGQDWGNARVGGGSPAANNDLIEKIEDYGKKTKSLQDELLRLAEQETKELNAIKDISRTGFSKLYQKVESVLVMEGQLTRLSQDMRSWTPKFTQISNQMTDFTKNVNGIKTNVEWNSIRLQNISGAITTALGETNNETSNSTKRILQIADRMKDDMSQLEDNFGFLKIAIETAKQLESDLRAKVSRKNADSLKRLIEELEEAEFAQLPLMSRLVKNNKDLNMYLRGSVSRTFDDFSALIDAMESKRNCSVVAWYPRQPSAALPAENPPMPEGPLPEIPQRLFDVKQGANQKDIFDKLSYVRNTLLSIQDDARQYCNNPSNQPNENLGLFLG